MNASSARTESGWTSTIGRGAGLFAGLGGVLGGLAATLDWPIVGTFFGVLEGAVAGAAFGVVDAIVLASLVRATSSVWGTRATSGVAAGAAALMAEAAYTGPIVAPSPATAAFITIAALMGAVFGPLIAFGMEPTPARQMLRFLAWGAGGGAGAGAVTGVVIGLRTYAPTAGVAAVEGALFGVVTGLMLACLAAAASLLPRVRARR